MFGLNEILHGNLGGLWALFQAPMIGALAALAGVLLGRWRRWPLLAAASGGLGAALAWWLIAREAGASPMRWNPTLWKWLPIAAAGAALCPLAARRLSRHAGPVCLGLLSIGGGWWLAGAPRQMAGLAQIGPLLAAMILALALGGRWLMRGGEGRLILIGFALSGALWVVKAPLVFLLLALAPALCALALLAAPVFAPVLLLPLAIDLVVAALASVQTAGQLPHLGLNALDIAAVAPFLAAALAARLRLSAPMGAGISLVGAILLAWAGRALLPA